MISDNDLQLYFREKWSSESKDTKKVKGQTKLMICFGYNNQLTKHYTAKNPMVKTKAKACILWQCKKCSNTVTQ